MTGTITVSQEQDMTDEQGRTIYTPVSIQNYTIQIPLNEDKNQAPAPGRNDIMLIDEQDIRLWASNIQYTANGNIQMTLTAQNLSGKDINISDRYMTTFPAGPSLSDFYITTYSGLTHTYTLTIPPSEQHTPIESLTIGLLAEGEGIYFTRDVELVF